MGEGRIDCQPQASDQQARGYRNVLVNGEVTIEDAAETGANAGQLLRHGVGRRAKTTTG